MAKAEKTLFVDAPSKLKPSSADWALSRGCSLDTIWVNVINLPAPLIGLLPISWTPS